MRKEFKIESCSEPQFKRWEYLRIASCGDTYIIILVEDSTITVKQFRVSKYRLINAAKILWLKGIYFFKDFYDTIHRNRR